MERNIIKLKVDNKDKDLATYLKPQWSWKTLVTIAIFSFVLVFVVNDLEIDFIKLVTDSSKYFGDILSRMLPPDFSNLNELVYAMFETIEFCDELLPRDQPRYLMGVGRPSDLIKGVLRGIDMFDCVMPTRNGRNGMLFTSEGIINIKNKKWTNDFSSIDPENISWVDNYSKAYLRHLFTVNEMLGKQIASIHNLGFYRNLMQKARNKIIDGDFLNWKNKMVVKLSNRL